MIILVSKNDVRVWLPSRKLNSLMASDILSIVRGVRKLSASVNFLRWFAVLVEVNATLFAALPDELLNRRAVRGGLNSTCVGDENEKKF